MFCHPPFTITSKQIPVDLLLFHVYLVVSNCRSIKTAAQLSHFRPTNSKFLFLIAKEILSRAVWFQVITSFITYSVQFESKLNMSDKPDTVPGLGFKDKDKALETIKNLEGRDPEYQKFAIQGLIRRAKRTLTLTKDEEKLQNIKDAVSTFEAWVKNYEKNHLARENRAYLPLASVEILRPLVKKYGIENEKAEAFLKAYKEAKAEYKNLRTVASGENEPTWDIVRNSELKVLMKEIDEKDPELWGDDDLPTKEHMELIIWAYSPEAPKIKKNLSKLEEKLGTPDKSEEDEEMEEVEEKKAPKRKSSGEENEESPKKKNKSE